MTTRKTPRIPGPRNPAFARVTKGREAVRHAADTGCPLYTWNEQKGWVEASVSIAQRCVAEIDALPAGGLKANGECSLLLYAVPCA